MPTINDAIVGSGSGYTTIGNGGRKLVKTSNNNIFAAVKDSTHAYLYMTTDNWNTKTVLNSDAYGSIQDSCLATDGDHVFFMVASNNNSVVVRTYKKDGSIIIGSSAIDSSQTSIGNVSLTINEAKTELHAAWASKNSTYPNSFNIRYAKGTINADGTVTWGVVEQVTTLNGSSFNIANLSVIVYKNLPGILYSYGTDSNFVGFLNKNDTTKEILSSMVKSDWGNRVVYQGVSYTQSSPSAIYVPQSINGLANGRIWVSWNGKSSTSGVDNIKMSYSDDNGVSWSNVIEVTTGYNNQVYPTISYNKKNEVFIVWQGFDTTVSSSWVNVRKVKYANGTLSTIETVTNNTTSSAAYPNSIPSGVDFDSPLFIYTNLQTSSVNFYGSWSVETISPPVGERGQILNRQNMLTYNITSESKIGTVTEKINGVVVETKTLASGQNTTINITQSQWDAIPYGKYRNNSAGRNTIEIVTSNNTFTFTFEKWFDNTLDVISVTKAVKDSKDYYLPSAKKILSDAINSKGGSTTPTDSIENMASQVSSTQLLKSVTGTAISSSTTKSFTLSDGTTTSQKYITIDTSSLGFTPKLIKAFKTDKAASQLFVWNSEDYYTSGSNKGNYSYGGSVMRISYVNGAMDLPVNIESASYDWIAYS